jgi:hypothetical protein
MPSNNGSRGAASTALTTNSNAVGDDGGIDSTKPAATQSVASNIADISAHLYALFAPAFVQPYPDAWIEIAYSHPEIRDGAVDQAQTYSAFELKQAAEFAEAKNRAGFNIYVGPALRHGKPPREGRANEDHVLTSAHAWAEYDGAGDDARIDAILKSQNLSPALIVTTGTIPHLRRHLYFMLNGTPNAATLEAVNKSLKELLGTDAVQNPDRVMRLAGTVNYPTAKKRDERGYVAELVTLQIKSEPQAYHSDQLLKLTDGESNPYLDLANSVPGHGKTDDELIALLKQSRATPGKGWREPMLKFTASTVGKHWTDIQIKLACAPYSDGGVDDPDIQKLIDTAREKFGKPDAADDAPPKPVQRFLTLNQWRIRDLPSRDLLLGEVFSTTSRAILFAKTGLGKTNLALAIAMRMAAGVMFLHWQGWRKCRVLYIDGEMSRALLKERLLGEEDRLFKDVSASVRDQFKPDGFHALNTEDIEGFAPLNTKQGQTAIDNLVAEIGGVDFIVFDNIMSLIPGSMREEEPWQKAKPWVKDLTKRRIGQLWVHHANDDDKLYGDKTRMWEMDAVIDLTEVKRDDTDISFNLSFKNKARERTPKNRDDFQDIYIYLANDRWLSDKVKISMPKEPSPVATKYLEALTNVVAGGGGAKMKRIHNLVAVHCDDWKAECEHLGLLDPLGQKNIHRAKFYKYRGELVAGNRVACEGEFTWIR